MRSVRSVVVVLLLAAAALVAVPAIAQAAAPAAGAPTAAQVAAVLRQDPLYVAPGATTPAFDQRAVRAALTAHKDTADVAVLPAASAADAAGDPAALPGVISAATGGTRSVVVIVGVHPYASSTTIAPDQLQTALGTAGVQLAVPGLSQAGATSALVDLVTALDPNAAAPRSTIEDAPSPSRAGSPGGLLIALILLGAGVIAAIGIPLWLRRNPRAGRRRPPPPPPSDRARVEVDASGRIIRRTPAPQRPMDRRAIPRDRPGSDR